MNAKTRFQNIAEARAISYMITLWSHLNSVFNLIFSLWNRWEFFVCLFVCLFVSFLFFFFLTPHYLGKDYTNGILLKKLLSLAKKSLLFQGDVSSCIDKELSSEGMYWAITKLFQVKLHLKYFTIFVGSKGNILMSVQIWTDLNQEKNT